MTKKYLVAVLLAIFCNSLFAAKNDWAEGTAERADGASRDYYNRAGLLKWKNHNGDWRDAANVEQGSRAFSTSSIVDDDMPRFVEWNATTLVQAWIDAKYQNQGMLLHAVEGGASHFYSREYADDSLRPQLIVSADKRKITLAPVADTHLDRSTYRSLGDQPVLKVTGKSNNTLLRFDLSGIQKATRIDQATLRLFTFAQYGSTQIGVFRCAQGDDLPAGEPLLGLASKYPDDRGIEADPDVIFFTDFQSARWAEEWTFAAGKLDTVANDSQRRFEPFQAKAVRVKIAQGSTSAMNVGYKFREETDSEPEEIYFRYYLRLADDWQQTLQGGKLPGISGTYGVAGWGGRKSNGRDGWSARGSFHLSIPKDNPLGGLHPIGTYCYHADMKGNYGNIWLWQNGYRGYLQNNRWYSIEQFLKLNTPGKNDGVIRAWVDGRQAFEKTDIRFRHLNKLKIEQIWMNVYHGGTKPSPYDQHLFIDNVVIAKTYIGPIDRGR
ncbi:MAG: DNRLRE domain-containing protein [Pirellulaceae bacterium]|nr:DNRLRE domain-containing protein [Pirellulaceae bacterium]HJN07588.1 DNRLRE domain-containing protein [Pirellulaceae bacterium]